MDANFFNNWKIQKDYFYSDPGLKFVCLNPNLLIEDNANQGRNERLVPINFVDISFTFGSGR